MQNQKSIESAARKMTSNAERQDTTRSYFRSLIAINIVLMVVVIGFLITLVVRDFMRRDIEYFARSPDGRIVAMKPLSDPLITTQGALFTFGDEAIQASFVLDFKNYLSQISGAEPFYTEEGFKNYKTVLDTQNYLSRIRDEKRVSSISRRGGWVLADESTPNGVHHWTIQAPVYLVLSGKDGDVTASLIVVFDIARVPNVDNPRGIAVSSFRLVSK